MRKIINRKRMNKRGDYASIVFIVIFLFVTGLAFLLVNKLTNQIYTDLISEISESDTNYTYASETLSKIKSRDEVVWDYAFLGIFVGSLIALVLSAYATHMSPIFYWIYGILALSVLILGVILSNIWQDLAADPEFATTITRFPITNFLLGTYFPLVVTAIIIFAMIILFGKPPGQEGYV